VSAHVVTMKGIDTCEAMQGKQRKCRSFLRDFPLALVTRAPRSQMTQSQTITAGQPHAFSLTLPTWPGRREQRGVPTVIDFPYIGISINYVGGMMNYFSVIVL
jgi:hypothetical protein